MSSDPAVWLARVETEGGGPLLAVKDCIDVAGLKTTVGCQVIAERARPATADATVVANARRQGARIIGKTNLAELCWSAVGVNSWSGTPVNPAAPGLVPGGSSSGSAVAVASAESDVAFGTDSGGSVRVPAACCAIAGLKTTAGRIPADGVYPLARSLDTVGPLGADLAAVELGMRLAEPGFSAPPYAGPLAAARMRPPGVDPAVETAIDAALAAAAIAVTDVPPIDFAAANQALGTIIDAEGYQANIELMPYLDRLSRHVQACMRAGAQTSPERLAWARRFSEQLRGQLDRVLAPVLVLPTLMGSPPRVGVRGIPLSVLTGPANLAGLPALALPLPSGAGFPVSLQVVGPAGGEEMLIGFGKLIEAALAG